ncbi:beta-ketoacyl synthase chain length factor [Nannocystis radixulma]|uniref:Beta-ketoacyl synthase chain length factor n=1 Tax=Nannocystis radixulma TaxID=2995305 RepID=A0ABT5BL95_9BACT|nr:beta-ketoacyl synthase chain length factor [Nannocystis radixulma]MDC0674294.1 beta-ketoacyl synthase chain length factor [Nannocystis radixulma]
MSALAFTVRGLGFWAPGYPDLAAWKARPDACPEDQSATPKAELLPPMMRRRTSLLTRMAAEVAAQALRAGGLDATGATLVYGSVYGEIRTTLDLLAALLVAGEPLSPTKFHNSVHNTAAGYVSIATGSRAGNAALSAGRSTLAMGLLECAALVAAGEGDVVLVIAEEPLPEPLAAGRRWGPFAAAFALSAPAPSDMPATTCRLEQGPNDMSLAPARPAPAWLADNPCAAALALVDALAAGAPARVALEPHLAAGWQCALGAGA